MNISRIHIRGFGKLEDFDISLSKGLNIIYGPNESGKSTLMAFIKAVLYGLKGGRTTDNKRYLPWSKAVYGGYMNFELDNGNTCRIDRAFDSGIVKLYDGAFNDITGLFAGGRDKSGIAESLIGINESLFEKTVYVRQLGTRLDAPASKDLLERISNIRQSGFEDISYNRAAAALKNALKEQVGTDRSYTRPLDIINQRLEELYTAKKNLLENLKNLSEAKLKQEELNTEIEHLARKEKLFADVIEFCTQRERLQHLNGKNDEIRFINDRIQQAQKNIDSLMKEKSALEDEAGNNKNLLKKLQEEQNKYDALQMTESIEKKRSSIKKLNIICLIILLLTAASGACIPLGLPPAVPVLSVAAEVILWNLLRLKFKNGLKELEAGFFEFREKEQAVKKQAADSRKLEDIFDEQLLNISGRLETETLQYEQLFKRLENISAGFLPPDLAKCEQLTDSISEAVNRQMETAVFASGEKELLDSIMEYHDEGIYRDINRIKAFITGELQQKKVRWAAVESSLKQNTKTDPQEAIDLEIQDLLDRKKKLEQRREALSLAAKTLEEATDSVRKKYLPVMNRVFNGIFSGITAQKYKDTRAGDNLNIMLNDTGTDTIVPVSSLSSGAADQLYLALRLAVAETVLNIKEGYPLIMDEPFSQYDDERTENTLKFIYEISQKQQVIIFCCKQRECELACRLFGQDACKICSLT